MRSALAPLALLAFTAALRAQAVDGDELLHLEPVLRAAMMRAAPFVVTLEPPA